MRHLLGRSVRRARFASAGARLAAVGTGLALLSGVLAAPALAAPGSASAVVSAKTAAAKATTPAEAKQASAKTILLLNGDRMVVSGKTTNVSLAGGGFASAVTKLRLAGRQYAVPDVALPFLGRGLDLSLFDIAARPGGSTLPVRISYSGRAPRLTGVTITKAAQGIETGYLTAAGAKKFGAALARQFAADRTAGSYGSDGLFANGVWISATGVAGAAATRAVWLREQGASTGAARELTQQPQTPAFKMHRVTLRGVTAAGQADTGDLVFLFDSANNAIFGDPYEDPNVFYHGTARFSLPAGNYYAFAWFTTVNKKGQLTGLRAVLAPRIAITGDATITLRATDASSEVSFAAAEPTNLIASSVQFTISDTRDDINDFELIQGANMPVWISPTTRRLAAGSLEEFVNGWLQAKTHVPASPQTIPDLYAAEFQDVSGLIHAQHFVLPAKSLATVHAVYASDVTTTSDIELSGFTDTELLAAGTIGFFIPVQAPAKVTEHLTGGPGMFWQNAYYQSDAAFGGGQSDVIRTFAAGSETTQDWNVYPLHTPLNTNVPVTVPGAVGFFGVPLSATRVANTLSFNVTPFTDDTTGHSGTGFEQGFTSTIGTISGSYQVDVNGKKRQQGKVNQDFPSFFDSLTLPAGASTVSVSLRAQRTGELFPLSRAVSDTWSWRSGTGVSDSVPSGWFCADGSSRCEVEPLLTFGYQVANIGLDGTTPPGSQQVRLTVGHQSLVTAPAAVTGVTAQYSLDAGQTWQPATVTGSGSTRTLGLTAPAGSYVTLKVHATDAAGGSLTERIDRAFATETAVAAAHLTAAQQTAAQQTVALAVPAAKQSDTAHQYQSACAAPGAGQAQCFVLFAHEPAGAGPTGVTGSTGGATTKKLPSGLSPQNLEHAYKLPVGRPATATVAVVEAFDTPKLETYLNDYRREYGLGPCTTKDGCFRKVGQTGSAKHRPASGVLSGWDLEATLDVDMVSAACPSCRILVVEANGQDFDQLGSAENTAIRLGATVVSNSYGGRETGQSLTDAKDYDHPGHVIVASSGDFGYSAASFPANLTTVTAAGGTELVTAKNKRGWHETAWNTPGEGASSSGCSAYVAKPSWQHDKNCPGRTVADVSAAAFNIAIYNKDWGGWNLVAGTSAASPLIAGIYGLAGNATKIKPGYEYAHAKDLFDVTSGNNDWWFEENGAACGRDYLCVAKPGYDAPTGLGAPDGIGAF